MTKSNPFLKWMIASFAMLIALTSCNQDLQDDVDDLKNRVITLEESVNLLDQAIKSGKLITDVSPVAPTTTNPAGGWVITFSDKSQIPINHGNTGATGSQGPQGIQGQTPYIWINSAGNWASNMGSKPVDADNASYEIKVAGKSVKANGVSVRVVDKGGYVAFEEYDAITNTIKNTVTTNFPFNGGMIITAIVETNESVTFTIDSKTYTLTKAAIYPTSITVIRDKDYLIKGGTVSFNIAVNPASSKVYEKENFELDFEKHYTRAYGINPDFVKIKDVQPDARIKGQYTMTLEWAESASGFVKDAAIFIVLNHTDVEGKQTQIVSSTPVIMNEQYVSLKAENVLNIDDIVMFSDETFTDSVRLSNYHQGYVNTITYGLTANPTSSPLAINPIVRYLTPDGDKYQFTVLPFGAENTTVWPDGVLVRYVDAVASVTDYGRAKVDPIPAKPEIGQPETPGIPAINPITINEPFKVTVYKVPADDIIFTHDFEDRWLPNKTVDYTLTQTLSTSFGDNGYNTSKWDFAIKSQDLQLFSANKWNSTPMDGKVTADISKFDKGNNFAVSYKLLPTINAGKYQFILTVTATSKTARPAELQQSREFKIKLSVNVVAPKFQIFYKGGHTLIGNSSNTHTTYTLANVSVGTLFDVESTQNISKAADVTPNAEPLAYGYDMTDPRHGAQGIRFNPYPSVIAPAVTDWGSLMFIKKPVYANVKLDTGQEISVGILCTETNTQHSINVLYVQYDRLNLEHVDSKIANFAGNYSAMEFTGIDITVNKNFTPQSLNNTTLDPTMIKSIVYSAQGTVKCDSGIPNGLEGTQIMQVDTNGNVTSIKGVTWQNPDAILYQVFRTTYTDIWGNTAFSEVTVYVKSNSIPALP